MSKEAMKLALEALESCDAAHITDGGHQWYDEKLVGKAIEAIEQALAEQALDKKAENARELGLDYEPAPMSQPNRVIAYSAAMKLRELGYEWVDGAWRHLDELAEQPAQQQEPVAGVVLRDGQPTLLQDKHIKEADERLFRAAPPPSIA